MTGIPRGKTMPAEVLTMWLKAHGITLTASQREAFLRHSAMNAIVAHPRALIQGEIGYHRKLNDLEDALVRRCHVPPRGGTPYTPPPPRAPRTSTPQGSAPWSKAKPRWDGSDRPDNDPRRRAEERRLAQPKTDKPEPYN